MNDQIYKLIVELADAELTYLYARSCFKSYPCSGTKLALHFAANEVAIATRALDEELKRIEKAKTPAPCFTISIETPRKTLSYNYISEHDAMLAYEKARLDMKLSRESNRVTLSRGDSVLRSADLM